MQAPAHRMETNRVSYHIVSLSDVKHSVFFLLRVVVDIILVDDKVILIVVVVILGSVWPALAPRKSSSAICVREENNVMTGDDWSRE